MNVAYNTALRQSKAIRAELTNLSSKQAPSPAEIGNVSASLATFAKSIDEYNALARQEIVPKKQEEAIERTRDDALHQANRSELLGNRRPYQASSTPENPYAHQPQTPRSPGQQQYLSTGSGDVTRESHALREQNFFATTNSALDDYIARGQAVLSDLGHQREVLKGTQKRLYSVANTLGVSGDTIRMVERRAREDKWIFLGGVIIFFLFCWLVLHFLR
uniref:Protein transport protein BOS1 n=1 Tax=Bionectria ochroleuca TaxID=29856 RepID=A0A8H7N578_BIOOC